MGYGELELELSFTFRACLKFFKTAHRAILFVALSASWRTGKENVLNSSHLEINSMLLIVMRRKNNYQINEPWRIKWILNRLISRISNCNRQTLRQMADRCVNLWQSYYFFIDILHEWSRSYSYLMKFKAIVMSSI